MSTFPLERFVSRTRWRVESNGTLTALALLACACVVFFASYEAGGLAEGSASGPPTGELQPLHSQAGTVTAGIPHELAAVPALSDSLAAEPPAQRGSGGGTRTTAAASSTSAGAGGGAGETLTSVTPPAPTATPITPVVRTAPVSTPEPSSSAGTSPAPAREAPSGGSQGSFDSSG